MRSQQAFRLGARTALKVPRLHAMPDPSLTTIRVMQ
jgi:hypothetical protein